VIFSLAFTAKLNPKASRMWQAYSVAAPIAPLSYVAWQLLGDTPANRWQWLQALYVWVLVSYAVGAVVAMPIAFWLRRAGKLHGLSIFTAALAGSFAFATYVAIRTAEDPLRVSVFAALRSVTIPCALAGLVFWCIAGYDDFDKVNNS
jgi:hypothetical protein